MEEKYRWLGVKHVNIFFGTELRKILLLGFSAIAMMKKCCSHHGLKKKFKSDSAAASTVDTDCFKK